MGKFESMEQRPKIVTISLPEYTIDKQPNYAEVGVILTPTTNFLYLIYEEENDN